MLLQSISLRTLSPWLVSFTLIGLIDLLINGFGNRSSLLFHFLVTPARFGVLLANYNLAEAFQLFWRTIGTLYLAPLLGLPTRLIQLLYLVKIDQGGQNWSSLLFQALLVLNSVVAVGLLVSLLRRMIRPGSQNPAPPATLNLPSLARNGAVAGLFVLLPSLFFWNEIPLKQSVISAVATAVLVLAANLGIAFFNHRMWRDQELSSIPTVIQKPSWIVPYFLAYTVIAFLAGIGEVAIALTESRATYGLRNNAADIRTGFVAAGVFFGLLGTIWGLRFNRASRSHVEAIFASYNLPDDNPLTQRTRALSARLGLTPPAVALMSATNALAAGSDQKTAAVILGTPLVDMLTHDELDAVIGHELGHVVTADMQRLQMTTGFESMFESFVTASAQITGEMGRQVRSSEGKLGVMFTLLGLALVRWIVLMLTRLAGRAHSRAREYRADAIGAALTSPETMIAALQKVHNVKALPTEAENRYGYLMFRPNTGALFSTHPPLEKRIDALRRGTYRIQLPELRGEAPVDPLSVGAAFGIMGTSSHAAGLLPSGSSLASSSPTGFVKPSPWIVAALAGPSRKAWWGMAGAAAIVGTAGVLAASVATYSRYERDRMLEVSQTFGPREEQLRGREQTLRTRETAVGNREQAATSTEKRNADRTKALDDREKVVQQREKDFESLRQNAGPETARLMQLQEKIREEQRTVAEDITLLARERSALDQTRQASDRAALTATAERERLEASRRQLETDRRNAGPEIARLEEQRRQLSEAQAALMRERQGLVNDRQAIEQEKSDFNSKERELSQRENDINGLRDQIVREWNAVVDDGPKAIHGALAIDSDGSWWGARNHLSVRIARQSAEQRCQRESRHGTCQIISIVNACVAVAKGQMGGWGYATGDSTQAAGRQAIIQCNSSGNFGCRVSPGDVFCSGK